MRENTNELSIHVFGVAAWEYECVVEPSSCRERLRTPESIMCRPGVSLVNGNRGAGAKSLSEESVCLLEATGVRRPGMLMGWCDAVSMER